ncbi:MAG: hypothetical protein H6548_06355 [Chitinophagales bacterium]|nr:hypothetical protein [Chitinophagales bacterium]MCB9021721.1 hypothetical protein [Chitinophagales bacterium]MCB9031028.1 hypothetical protein [Chitinophagales bacterium]HPE96416.1 hypothetical protein [Chitinophagales bacterium]HPR28917.1 hypothetical protein [Chitinophagales bacterium]
MHSRLLLSLLLLSPVALIAQTNGQGLFGVDLVIGLPQDEFKEVNKDALVGVMVNFLYQPSPDIPISIGGDLGWMGNGRKVQYEELTADITAGGVLIDQLYFPLRIETSNNVFTGHLLVRATAPTKIFKPYAEGFVGFNNFFTTTAIYDESEEFYFSEEDNPLITSQSQSSDWGLSYGGAAGVLVELGQTVMLNLRCAYNLGTTVQYYTRDDIQNWEVEVNNISSGSGGYEFDEDNVDVSAIPKSSSITMIQPTVGIAFRF